VVVAGIIALQAFRLHCKVKPGDEVLVNGASGGVGSYAVQIAKVLGARVTAVCSAKNAEYVKELGADAVIDYGVDDFRSWKNSFDVILDAASNAVYKEVKKSLKRGGILIKLNLSIGTILTRLRTCFFSSKKLKLILVKNRHSDIRWLIKQLTSENIKIFIEKTYPLESAKEALENNQRGRVRGKLVLKNMD